MRSRVARIILQLIGAIAVVTGSFWITTTLLDNWGAPTGPNTETHNAPQMQEPAYDAAVLPHLSAGQTLDFSNGQNRAALLTGWSGPEPSGTWSVGHAAYLGLIVNGTPAPKQAIVQAVVYLDPGQLNAQHVEVWLGGKKVAAYELKNANAELAIPLGNGAISNGASLIIGLYLPDAQRQVRNVQDARELGIFIKALHLVP